MKKIQQTICDKEKGDCLRACVASLFNLNIEQVPHFILFDGRKWQQVFWGFLASIDIKYNGVRTISNGSVVQGIDCIDGLVIAGVNSLNIEGVTHAVLMNKDGLVVHDPSNDNSYEGINIIESKELLYFYSLSKSE